MSTRHRLRIMMRRLGQSRVRVRVTIAATLVAGVAAAVGSTVFVLSLRGNLVSALMSSASQQAAAVTAQLDRGTTPRQAVVSGLDDVTTQVIDPQGNVVASDRPGLSEPLRQSPGVSRNVRAGRLHDTFIVVAMRSRSGDLVVVGRSEEHVEEAGATAIGLLLLSVPAGLVLLAVVIWISIGRALRPVEGMRQEAAAITSEHLHRRLPVPQGNDEISLLAQTLNEMLDGIDSAQRLQRQFVSDASHELRSPLASVRQLAEVAARRPDSAGTRELAEEVLAEEQRMEGLVTALLTLARLDDDSHRRSVGLAELDDIVIDEVSRARRIEPSILVNVPELTAAQVRGNSLLLTQLVRNLVSNALRHATSRVEVTLTCTSDAVRLLVDDDGKGIPPQDRHHVFERFVRLDEARDRDAGGSGLGLAIVRKVAESSGGTVTIEESPLGGARLAVTLPDSGSCA